MTHEPLRRRDGVGCDQILPGCDYTAEEAEFLVAIDRYKRSRRRPHPTWREILNVLRDLGWRKQHPTPSAGGN